MNNLIETIENLTINSSDKELLVKAIKAFQKNEQVLDFKFKRTTADKIAITNILNASINEVKNQKKIIEQSKDEINRTLIEMDFQKKLIENKNEELNKLLSDLRETQQQLVMSEKMASLGQLTAGVAHEINNPINFVSANIKPLKEDLAEVMDCIDKYDKIINENNLNNLFAPITAFKNNSNLSYTIQEIKDLLQGIEEGARRTTEIVKGLRNFSRLDQNEAKPTDINECIESTLTLLHSTFKDKAEIVKDFEPISAVECLAGQINQVLMNIISNAIQSIKENGKIIISTHEENEHIEIKIKDNGIGMNESTKQKIFDPFFTTKEVGKGTGLGLSISYGIIKKHKGKITVTSELGKGTCFTISLPKMQKNNFNIKTT